MIDILTLICNKFLLCVVNVAAILYVISVTLNKKFDFRHYKTYLSSIGLTIALILNFLLVNDLVRILISTIVIGFANYLIFKEDVKTTIEAIKKAGLKVGLALNPPTAVDEVIPYMEMDAFCKDGKFYSINNIYFDTENNDLIRTSIDKPAYKEKLSLRS